MNKNFNEQMKIENLANELLSGILQSCPYKMYLTTHQKQSYQYYEEFIEKFKEGLDDDQKRDLETLEDIRLSALSTELDYQVLYGMRVKVALDQLINDPLKILEVYESNATNVSETYKSVEQIREEGKSK